MNIMVCMDNAYVGFGNYQSKVWTIHSLDSKWAQCVYHVTK